MKRYLLLVLYLLSFPLIGQVEIQKGYFEFPIKPGQVNYLTGSMGELRANHFHAGIDIKTDFKIGLPVYCSADGFVSRVRISSFGYGKVVYVTHPNGLTTVYAHLHEFSKEIAVWALTKQYQLTAFEIDLYPSKDEILVKKGQVIAKSGNTGSSGGPHLHYEIRDGKENVWNPLLFGFKEIKDELPPIVDFLAIRTFGIGSFIENEFGRKEYKTLKIGSKYTLPKSLNAIGTIGIEIKTHDRMNGTQNSYGISCIDMKVNGKETFYHNINNFSFDDGRKINAHIDFETLVYKKQRFQNCYISDGNPIASYKSSPQNGKLLIENGQSYKIEINVYDAYGNMTTLAFTIDGKEVAYNTTSNEFTKGGYRIFENVLKIKGKVAKDTLALFYAKTKRIQVAPSYLVNGVPVYLYDLRSGLLDSIRILNYLETFNFVGAINPGERAEINYDNFKIQFSDTALLDTMFLQLHCIKDISGNHCINIHDPTVPIFGKINVIYSPSDGESIHPNSYLSLNGRKYEQTTLNNDGLIAETKYLGKFVIVKDTSKPVVTYISHTPTSIKFSIKDIQSGIDSISAYLNGEWLLMNYEHKSNLIWSESLPSNLPLKGSFRLEIKDKAGNKTILKKQL